MWWHRKRIIEEIRHRIGEGRDYADRWYIGTCSNAKKRLFEEHGVSRDKDWWIYRWARSPRDARIVRDHFIQRYGADGNPSADEVDGDTVYAYRKEPHTHP